MSIPDYQSIMLPLLRYAEDQKEHSLRETIEVLTDEFELSNDERKELLPSGQQAIFDNRVGWARTYLKKAGLLTTTRRAFFKITNRGIEVLGQNPKEINVKFLKRYPEFIEFQTAKKDKDDNIGNKFDKSDEKTPQEVLEYAYQKLNTD